jgi:nucleoside-diphosphate-sugar epimerase
VAGTGAVVHMAARVHVMHERALDPLAEFRGANLVPTVRLAEAAARQGVPHFVFISSVKVNGERTRARAFTELDKPHPIDAYGVSKREAEDALLDISQRTGMAVTVLRCPLMYGPGVKGNFERLMRWIARGVPLPFARIDNRRSLLYVGNFASAVLAALEGPRHGTRTYLLSDGEDLSSPGLVRRLATALHCKPRLLPVPVALLECGARLTGRQEELRRLTDSLVVDSSRARRELAWTPPYAVDEGLAHTAEAAASAIRMRAA